MLKQHLKPLLSRSPVVSICCLSFLYVLVDCLVICFMTTGMLSAMTIDMAIPPYLLNDELVCFKPLFACLTCTMFTCLIFFPLGINS